MLERDTGEVGGDAGDYLTPEARGFKHVGLIDRDQFVAAALSDGEGDAGDALNLVLAVAHGVPGALAGNVKGARLAEIEAAEEFAHDEKVGAVDAFGAQGRGAGKGLKGHDGTQIDEAAKLLTQG